jgi:hypothetical protein
LIIISTNAVAYYSTHCGFKLLILISRYTVAYYITLCGFKLLILISRNTVAYYSTKCGFKLLLYMNNLKRDTKTDREIEWESVCVFYHHQNENTFEKKIKLHPFNQPWANIINHFTLSLILWNNGLKGFTFSA